MEKKLTIGFVGPASKNIKKLVVLITGHSRVHSRYYASIDELFADRNRPSFDLTVVSMQAWTNDGQGPRRVKRIIDTKAVLFVKDQAAECTCQIDDMTAIVHLPSTYDQEQALLQFQAAASKRHRPDWPWQITVGVDKPEPPRRRGYYW